MKKLLTIMTAFVLALAVAMPVMAADKTYGDVKDITNENTIVGSKPETNAKDGVVKGEETTIITYTAASLKTINEGSKETGSEGRTGGYAWVGVKIDIPNDYVAKEEDGDKYEKADVDTATTIDRYFGVSLAKLNEAVENGDTALTYAKTFTWGKEANDDENYEQTIKVVINLDGVTLYEGENATVASTPVWNKEIYAEKKAEVEKAKEEAAEENKKEPAKEEVAEEKAEEDEKDDTANTGVENVYAIAGLVAMVTIAGVVVLNKRK